MRVLIRFSLHKRFKNKSTICFNILLCIGILGAIFSDKVVHFFDPEFSEQQTVYTSNIDVQLQTYLQESQNDYIFMPLTNTVEEHMKQNELVIEKIEQSYIVHSKYILSTMEMLNIQNYLSMYEKQKIMETSQQAELLEAYNAPIALENKVLNQKDSMSETKANIIFMFVSSVYFMMLSFISGVASEVVNEKTTKTLELILTSVSAKLHFYSKIIVGWLVIVLQGIASISYIIITLLIRQLYDQGAGLIAFLKQMKLLETEALTFQELIATFDLTSTFLMQVIMVLLFLCMGIFMMQLILVIISSFTATIEEASNIQAPFYLLLLGIYYLVTALNNPQDLSEGLGYTLSFVPLFNMLLMPCRIMAQQVPISELIVSLLCSITILICIINRGILIYEKGVLDYSNNGLKDIVRKNISLIKKSKHDTI